MSPHFVVYSAQIDIMTVRTTTRRPSAMPMIRKAWQSRCPSRAKVEVFRASMGKVQH